MRTARRREPAEQGEGVQVGVRTARRAAATRTAVECFTVAQAARLSGCSASQLRHWASTGLIVPSSPGVYEFCDLVALRLVRSLLDAGLPLGRVRAALRHLVETGEDLAGLRLVTDGTTVWACRDDGEILDALRSGQLALFVAVDRLATETASVVAAFDRERRAFVAGLHAAGPVG